MAPRRASPLPNKQKGVYQSQPDGLKGADNDKSIVG